MSLKVVSKHGVPKQITNIKFRNLNYKCQDLSTGETSGSIPGSVKGTKVTFAGIYYTFPGEGDLRCGGSAPFGAK